MFFRKRPEPKQQLAQMIKDSNEKVAKSQRQLASELERLRQALSTEDPPERRMKRSAR
ncbi:MAG: hypothetical protein AAF346_04860 [Pseudomonadota bacterium]